MAVGKGGGNVTIFAQKEISVLQKKSIKCPLLPPSKKKIVEHLRLSKFNLKR